MNILIFSWRGPKHPFFGGAEQVTFHHASAWAKAGHRVYLFTSSFVAALPTEVISGVTIIRQGWQYFGVQFLGMLWYFFGRHPKFDLVVDEIHGLPFFTPLYVSGKKLGYVHEVAQKVWALNPWPKPFNLIPAVLGKLGEPLIYQLLYRHIPFMTVSPSTQSDLRRWGVSNVTVINNGVTLPETLPQVAKESLPTFIFLSALAKDKGVEDALKSFSYIKKQLPQARFWVVGKGDPAYVAYLRRLCGDLPVKFWGYVSEKEKFTLLAKAHIIIFPSVHEGWGLVIIEANAVGTPAVVYPSAGLVDSTVDGQTGLITKQSTPQELADFAVDLFNLPSYAKYCQSAKKWASQFSWSKTTTASLALINSL